MECVFCNIINGKLPAFKIYEDDQTLAFLDTRPVTPGHVLVIPKNHAQNIFDVSAEDWAATMETVRKIAPALEDGLGVQGVNLEMNNRERAGQIVDHVHVHVIPRYPGDGLRHWPQSTYKENEAEEILKKVRGCLQ
jgi:histidine triad (HIT) family protein